MTSHFFLKRLSLYGPELDDATLDFGPGLNVVHGASDTGKTFIAQCIDFAFGARKLKRVIPEAEEYAGVRLTISSAANGDDITLQRSLRGGDITISRKSGKVEVVAAEHDSNDDASLSRVLLKMLNLDGRRVIKNDRGDTRAFSFRDVARVTIVDETAMFREGSPILSGQQTRETSERNAFRVLITGHDDSEVQAGPNPTKVKAMQAGAAAVLEELAKETRGRFDALGLAANPVNLHAELQASEEKVRSAEAALTEIRQSAASLEARREVAWDRLRTTQSKTRVAEELQKRFRLLAEQYSTDLARLHAVAEAAHQLHMMREERCSLCGAAPEHHAQEHREGRTRVTGVLDASRVEAEKIALLAADLNNTIAQNDADLASLQSAVATAEGDLLGVEAEIRTTVEPRIAQALADLNAGRAEYDRLKHALELLSRASDYEKRAGAARTKRFKRVTVESASVGQDADELCRIVETLLREWHFPNVERIGFDEEAADLTLDGRARAGHGKGVRALTHAAFNLGLLRYCLVRNLPHPGFVVLDSPLVVYKAPDPDEAAFPAAVKPRFYHSVARDFADVQVIVLENDAPPAGLSGAKVTHFSKSTAGRYGFVPVKRLTRG